MAFNERTSPRIASIAGRGLLDLRSVTDDEIREVFVSVLTEAPDTRPNAVLGSSHQQNAMAPKPRTLVELAQQVLDRNARYY
jgi:hypothetical protein